MARRIGTVTFVRNCENFIIPHLKMLEGVDKRCVLYLNKPFKPYTQYHPPEPDRARHYVEVLFPEVQIGSTDIEEYGSEVYNAALDMVKDCDIALLLHADNFLEKHEMELLLAYLRSTDYDCYTVDFPKCFLSYYHDFEHGIRDALDHDPMAVNPKMPFSGIMSYTGGKQTEIDFITFHHFVGWEKGIASKQEWIDGAVKDESGRTSKELQEKHGGWVPAPQEIRDMFLINKRYGLRYE